MPRCLEDSDSRRDRLEEVGEVEDDRLPLLPPRPLPRARCDRLEEVEEVEDDPRPLPLVVVVILDTSFCLDLDLDRYRDRRSDDCDRDLDRSRDRDLDRDLDLDLDLRLCRVSVVRRVLLDGLRPYLLPLVLACCDCFLESAGESLDVESVAVVGVLEEVFESACPPGDSGGVELVTGVNTVSLLTLTSQCPVLLYLVASSANKT